MQQRSCVAFEVESQATVTTDPRERSFERLARLSHGIFS